MHHITLSDIQKTLAAEDPAKAWTRYLTVTNTFKPFWSQAVTHMAALTALEKDKAAKYQQVLDSAFDKLDDWYFERVPYVRARRNEIDTVISFIRNGAHRTEVSATPAAPAARNLASSLRTALYLAIRNYRPEDYPRLMAGSFMELAAVKSLFPVDLFDVLSQFSEPGKLPLDNIDNTHEILARAATHYGLQTQLADCQKTLDELWQQVDAPQVWKPPVDIWVPQKTSLMMRVHQQGVEAFHNRPS